VSFFSEAPLYNIEAHNHQVTSIINIANGEIVFSGLMKGFEFEKALMQEHFNESYAESDKFPKTKFSGQIEDYEKINLKNNGSHDVTVKGELTIHGVSKPYSVKGLISREGNSINATAKFDVNVEEHGIKIPAGKINNIAKIVEITVDLKYQPYEK
jgi:polyisoprenoid-binding protein YceI